MNFLKYTISAIFTLKLNMSRTLLNGLPLNGMSSPPNLKLGWIFIPSPSLCTSLSGGGWFLKTPPWSLLFLPRPHGHQLLIPTGFSKRLDFLDFHWLLYSPPPPVPSADLCHVTSLYHLLNYECTKHLSGSYYVPGMAHRHGDMAKRWSVQEM